MHARVLTCWLALLCGGCGLLLDLDGTDSGDGSASPDAGVDERDGSVSPLRCASPSLLADSFDGADVSPLWWPFTHASVPMTQTGGELVIVPATGIAEQAFSGIFSRAAADVRGSEVVVRASRTPDPASEAVALLHLSSNELHPKLVFAVGHGLLNAAIGLLGGGTDDRFASYDPGTDVWLRIREQSGSVVWQTSADRLAWRTVRTEPSPAMVASAHVTITAGTFQLETAPAGEAHFDDLNAGLAPSAWCPASTLTDSFDGEVLGPYWENQVPGPDACYTQIGGRLALSLSTADTQCSVATAQRYDLTSDAIVVEVPDLPVGSGTSIAFSIRVNTGANERFGALAEDGDLGLFVSRDGLPPDISEVPYDPLQHRWIRLEESAGVVTLRTSGDGLSFEQVASLPHARPVSDVRIVLGAVAYAGAAVPVEVGVEAYNAP